MSVTSALGFRAAGVVAGLKSTGKPDIAVVVNDGPDRHAAAVFTTNRVAAAPVQWSRQAVSDGRADAVVLNSGGANACTGAPGPMRITPSTITGSPVFSPSVTSQRSPSCSPTFTGRGCALPSSAR